jgi:alpha-tubulin suppressor-like RCC1 family protein
MALKSDGSLWAWGYTDAGQFGNGTTAIAVTTLPTQVGTGFAAIAVSSFDKYTIAVKTDGTLWSWGINIQSQLGNDGVGDESCGKYSLNGSLIDLVCKKTPIQIGSGFVAVSAGQNISGGVLNVALKSDGTVVAWGANDNGQLGQADVNLLAVPVKVGSGFASVVSEGGETYPHQLRAGHSAAIRQDGTLWTWGKNDRGQLGDGTLTDKSVPSQIASGFSKVGVGQNFSIGLKTDGTLWSWGDNFYGTLGTGELCDSFNGKCTALTPRQTGTGYESVAVGDSHIAALKTDGSVWGWGNNYFGQLGFTTSKECDPSSAGYRCERTPVMILAAGSKVTQLAAGASHTVALKSDGSIWTWGFNQYGQLGDGGTVNRSSPLQVAAPGSGFIQVAAGRSHTIALKQDGSLWGWGDVSQGQIGNKGLTPIAIPTQFSPAGSQFTQIGAGRYHSVAVKQDGTVWASGGNWSGQVGDGTFANAAFPTLVVNTSLTDFLDLDSTAPNSIPSGVKPPFLVKASKSGDLSSLSLSVDMRGQLGVASTRSVAHSSGYNAYVAANSGAGGTVYWFQLDARKQWSGLTLPMAEFMTGVALSTNNDSIILDILDRIDLSSLADLHIYIGYGLDALEMVSTGRFREVMSISTLAQ